MVEGGGSRAATVVLCAACGDAVSSAATCPTCGCPEPSEAGGNPREIVGESLLDQVSVALAGQAALAQRRAVEHVARACQLYEESVVLRHRLRKQRELLRARVAARTELVPQTTEALRRVEGALERRSLNAAARWKMSAQLPRDSSCPAVARRLLEEHARQELGDEEGENALLIVSELVTNAFVHGQGAIMLSVCRTDDVLRIEVSDEGRPERIGAHGDGQRGERGRGLWIVEQLTSDWGAVAGTGRVWAELALASSAGAHKPQR